MTCSKCLVGSHLHCSDRRRCACSICLSRRKVVYGQRSKPTLKKSRAASPRKPRPRKVVHCRNAGCHNLWACDGTVRKFCSMRCRDEFRRTQKIEHQRNQRAAKKLKAFVESERAKAVHPPTGKRAAT